MPSLKYIIKHDLMLIKFYVSDIFYTSRYNACLKAFNRGKYNLAFSMLMNEVKVTIKLPYISFKVLKHLLKVLFKKESKPLSFICWHSKVQKRKQVLNSLSRMNESIGEYKTNIILNQIKKTA